MTFNDKISKPQLFMTFYDFMTEWEACTNNHRYINLYKHHCNQLLFGIQPHVYLIHYLGISVTAPTFLQISSTKIEVYKREGPNKSRGDWEIFRKNKAGGRLLGT